MPSRLRPTPSPRSAYSGHPESQHVEGAGRHRLAVRDLGTLLAADAHGLRLRADREDGFERLAGRAGLGVREVRHRVEAGKAAFMLTIVRFTAGVVVPIGQEPSSRRPVVTGSVGIVMSLSRIRWDTGLRGSSNDPPQRQHRR